jgi:hypothetical protein
LLSFVAVFRTADLKRHIPSFVVEIIFLKNRLQKLVFITIATTKVVFLTLILLISPAIVDGCTRRFLFDLFYTLQLIFQLIRFCSLAEGQLLLYARFNNRQPILTFF